jgi:PD-(D/E)XK endonuclease
VPKRQQPSSMPETPKVRTRKPRYPGRWSTTPVDRTAKRKGEFVELVFVVKATGLGFAVSKPYGDSEPYDLIVEADGRLLRIQVKAAFTTHRQGYSVSTARHGRGHEPRKYSARDIDFIAAYVAPHQVWYIVPVKETATRAHICLYPMGAKNTQGGRYEKYREAWGLLRMGAPSSK